MSRISRYQDSINKYMKTKSCLNDSSEQNKDKETDIKSNIHEIIDGSDYLVPIVLLTVLSCQSRKAKLSLHGYYMSCGIELLMSITKMMDCENRYSKYNKAQTKKITNKMLTLTNICLSQNIEHVQTFISKEKVLKIFHGSIKYLNQKTYNLIDDIDMVSANNIKKTDLISYSFSNYKQDELKEKIMSLKQFSKEQMKEYITRRFGSVCQISLVIGWLLGNGDDKMIDSLEKLGVHLGNIVKLSHDFKNLEEDLSLATDSSYNYVINCGIQESFELFIDSKTKFIEGCIKYDLYSNTMKEVIDLIEASVDNVINKSSLDLKSSYTLT